MDLPALKRIINWSSIGSVHDGIQVSMRCDCDLRWLKVNSFHSPGIFNDGQWTI